MSWGWTWRAIAAALGGHRVGAAVSVVGKAWARARSWLTAAIAIAAGIVIGWAIWAPRYVPPIPYKPVRWTAPHDRPIVLPDAVPDGWQRERVLRTVERIVIPEGRQREELEGQLGGSGSMLGRELLTVREIPPLEYGGRAVVTLPESGGRVEVELLQAERPWFEWIGEHYIVTRYSWDRWHGAELGIAEELLRAGRVHLGVELMGTWHERRGWGVRASVVARWRLGR